MVTLMLVYSPLQLLNNRNVLFHLNCIYVILTYLCFLICRELAKDFVVAGSASESLYGACESMFKPDMVCPEVQLVFSFTQIFCVILRMCAVMPIFCWIMLRFTKFVCKKHF